MGAHKRLAPKSKKPKKGFFYAHKGFSICRHSKLCYGNIFFNFQRQRKHLANFLNFRKIISEGQNCLKWGLKKGSPPPSKNQKNILLMPIMVLAYIDTVKFAMEIILFDLYFLKPRPSVRWLSLLYSWILILQLIHTVTLYSICAIICFELNLYIGNRIHDFKKFFVCNISAARSPRY